MSKIVSQLTNLCQEIKFIENENDRLFRENIELCKQMEGLRTQINDLTSQVETLKKEAAFQNASVRVLEVQESPRKRGLLSSLLGF